MNRIKELIVKNKKMLVYLLCSGSAAAIEVVAVLILRRVIKVDIPLGFTVLPALLAANTAATVLSSTYHYFVTSRLVFKVKNSLSSVAVYIITFFVGLGIQNAVLWAAYNYVFAGMIGNEDLRTLVGKGCSLICSFFIVYFLRNALNARIKKRQDN